MTKTCCLGRSLELRAGHVANPIGRTALWRTRNRTLRTELIFPVVGAYELSRRFIIGFYGKVGSTQE